MKNITFFFNRKKVSKHLLMTTISVLFSMLLFSTSSAVAAEVQIGCHDSLVKALEGIYPKSLEMAQDVQAFAAKWNLPTKVLKVGPPERRVERLFVGIDTTNKELMDDYMKSFNLKNAPPNSEHVKGTLALEFQREQGDDYVTGVLRPSPNGEDKIFRWGRPDLPRPTWWDSFLTRRKNDAIYGYSHLIALDEKEVKNVEYFLDHPEERGKCKADNCVAWTAGIELGNTAKDATPEARRFLFSELGMARAMAHFEIGRRLMHAAGENHSSVMVFLNGDKGKTAFAEIEKHLPPDPKIPYENIIRNLGMAKDSPVVKAIEEIPDGAKIFVPIAAGASPEAMNALINRAEGLQKGFDVHFLVNGISEKALQKAADIPGDKFRMHALFLRGNARKLAAEGKVNVIPGYLGDFNRMVRDPAKTDFHYDAIVVRVSPPDVHGNYSLGPNYDMIMDIIKDRPKIKIIAEVNPNVPFTHGDNVIRENQITAKFESNSPLAGPAVVPPSLVDSAIGHQLGQLVNSGSTLQVGIGNIFGGMPDGLAAAGRSNIKIHTEMMGDPMKQMIQRGIADEAVTGFAYGSDVLYQWLNKNEKVRFASTEFVNNPGRVAEIPNFHAVNTALQVNLYGDVNATMGPGGVRMSSPGGQVEFMSGAARSPGGKAIIAIRSTAKQGELSTIGLDNYPGPVKTPHESVTHVVTEYGTAQLQGRSEKERALALINVAHPKFRQQLFDEAAKRGLVRKNDIERVDLNQKPLLEGGHVRDPAAVGIAQPADPVRAEDEARLPLDPVQQNNRGAMRAPANRPAEDGFFKRAGDFLIGNPW